MNESVHVPHGDEMRPQVCLCRWSAAKRNQRARPQCREAGKLHRIQNTGVLEDEGQYLQDVYPYGLRVWGPGRLGFDPRAHLTETSDLLMPENVARLRASWHAYWGKIF